MIRARSDNGAFNGEIDLQKVRYNHTIFKDKISFNNRIGIESYITASSANYYYSQELPKWEILREQKNINGVQCTKATTYYLGRIWYAWFSEQYPVTYGPYKFVG